MPWPQTYDPLHNLFLSTIVSWLPLGTFFFVLLIMRCRVRNAALSGLTAAILLALFAYRMPPLLIGVSALLGALSGWLRIAWIILAATYLYNIAVETGQFRIMRRSISSLTTDKRIQVILVSFCLGAFIEGSGGGGAAVAMVGALLVGLGFPPLQCAKVCLLANTIPLAWGGMGNPMAALAQATNLPEAALSAATGTILPFVSAILPLWLITAIVGWQKARAVLPAAVACGLSAAVAQFLLSRFGPPGLVDIGAAALSLTALVILLKLWQPGELMENDPAYPEPEKAEKRETQSRPSMREIFFGWSPFLFASAFIFISGIPAVNRGLSLSILKQSVPFLYGEVLRTSPIVSIPAPEPAVADLNIVAMNGTAIFLGATSAALMLGLSLRDTGRIFGRTFIRLIPSLLAASFMVGFLFVMRYSGILATMTLWFSRTGPLFPFFAAFIGWMGVSLSGVDTVSNSLFGHLQRFTAEQLGFNPILMAAANPCGGVMGKLMDPASILVSATATGQAGREGDIFKTVFKHSLLLTSLVGFIILVYSYLLRGLA